MKKIIMLVLDGLGISEDEEGNIVKQANMDCFNEIFSEYPHSLLKASGDSIGLPDNQFGDCKVGHMTLGAGKKIKQDITLCNEVLGSTLIEHNEKLIELIKTTKENNSNIHLMGLVSDGGIHSDITYIKHFFNHLKYMGVNNVKFHAITDGRDTKNNISKKFLQEIVDTLKDTKIGNLATICGRYYAMDKEENWDRTKVYTDLVVYGKGVTVKSFEKGIDACYKRELNDELVVPILIDEEGTIKDNDALIWLNFRSDRSKQILEALTKEDFNEYRIRQPKNLLAKTVLPVENLDYLDYLIQGKEEIYSIGNYLSDLGMKQARIAEEEKFKLATFYINGETKSRLKGCDNFLIESQNVKSVDEYPAMSAVEITKQAIKCIEKDYDFILVNYANPDMLGHSGNLDACKEGLEVLDNCLSQIVEAVDDNFYKLIITSDHGNVEEMISKDGEVKRMHSLNPVPFVIRDTHVNLKHKGDITQVAPTILKYMDIAIPKQMKETRTLFNDED